MTTYCLVDPTPAVLDLLQKADLPRASEILRRIERGYVHDISREPDRQICWLLFSRVREQEKRRPGPWAERSPLRDVINRRALIWHTGSDAKREYLARLPSTEPLPTEADYHEAVRHRWVQAELVDLGWHFQQSRSESELHIIGGDVDVAWDELAWEVDLSVQSPGDQKKRERVRARAGLRMIAIIDDAESRNELRAEVPEVYLSQLMSTAQSAVDGEEPSLGKLFVTNAYAFNFCDATWVEHEPVRFWRFCEALLEGVATYRHELSGGWHRKSCEASAALHQRATQKLQNMQHAVESLDQQLVAARNKLARAQALVDDLTECLATFSTLDLSRASDVDRLRSLSLARELVPEAVCATSLVWKRGFRWPRSLRALSDRLAKRRSSHDRLAGIHVSAARLAKRRIAEWPREELADCNSTIERLNERRRTVSSAQRELKRALVAGDQSEVEQLCDPVGSEPPPRC